jgi:ribosomal protein S26
VQVKRVFCESSGALVPKDKAVKRFIVRNIVESAAIRDLQESCVFDCACPGREGSLTRVTLPKRRSCRSPAGGRAGGRAAVPPLARGGRRIAARQAPSARLAFPLPATLNPIARRRAAPLAAYVLPKLYRKVYYSISAAIHSKVRRREALAAKRRLGVPRFVYVKNPETHASLSRAQWRAGVRGG